MKSYFYKTILTVTSIATLNNPFPAQANEQLWIPISNRTNGSTYLDVNSITKEGSTRTFWVYVSGKQRSSNKWVKIIAQGVANCSTKSTIYRQAKVYDRQDNQIESLQSEKIEQFNIEAIVAPDLTSEEIADFICNQNQ